MEAMGDWVFMGMKYTGACGGRSNQAGKISPEGTPAFSDQG